MQTTKSALTFPCDFPLKILGWANEDLESIVVQIVHKHVPNLTEAAIRTRKSQAEKYISITINFEATSQEQLDKLYQELNNHPKVLMTL